MAKKAVQHINMQKSTAAIAKRMAETFPPEYVTVIDGEHDAADMCLDERFDKINVMKNESEDDSMTNYLFSVDCTGFNDVYKVLYG